LYTAGFVEKMFKDARVSNLQDSPIAFTRDFLRYKIAQRVCKAALK
jgi:hypothetical protein